MKNARARRAARRRAYRCVPLCIERLEDRINPGLVASFGFNEGSGTLLNDLSANGNAGAISGATWVNGGRFGKALSFDGVNDRVTIADAVSLDLTTGMTLEAWVYPTAISGWETVLLKESNTDLAYGLYADNNGNNVGGPRAPGTWVRQGSSTTYALGPTQVPLNAWTHLAATYDGSVLQMYVNGEPAGSAYLSGPLNVTNKPLRIGGNAVWGEYFAGLIDEVRVYNKALTQVEIQQDMVSPVLPDTTPPAVGETFPAAGATGVSTGGDVTLTFNEPMDADTVTAATVELRDAANALVPSTVVYDAATFTATLTPSVVLNIASAYSVVVRGGAAGSSVADRSGNPLAADFTLSFITAPVVQPPPENVFARFDGEVASASAPSVVPIRVSSAGFTITHGADEPQGVHAVLGFVVSPAAGSTLLPRGVTIENTTPDADGCVDPARGVHVLKTRTGLPDGSSLVLVELGYGDFNVKVSGRNGTTGAWTLTTFLVGDVNGDFRVTDADVSLMHDYQHGLNKNPAVLAAGDADRNGRIRDYDLTLAGWNVGNATTVRVLGMTAGLDPASDTGVKGDGLVNLAIVNLAGLARPGATVSVDRDGDGYDDGEATAGPDGAYVVPAALAEGANALALRARDSFGQQAFASAAVRLDTQLTAPTTALSAGSDTGAAGDNSTSAGSVTLVGQTDAGETVTLWKAGAAVATALAAGSGKFQFAGVALALGENLFTARVEDAAGNVREYPLTLTRVAPDPNSQDVVLRWNQATLSAIKLDASAPPVATRALAMVSAAIFDAVSAIEGTPGYLVRLAAPAGASAEAAAAAAAHKVLSYLYPGQQANFDAALAASLAQVPAGPAKDGGEAFGRSVGEAVIAVRANDGSRDFEDYVTAAGPGAWQPTTPMYAEALLPQWADVAPFAMTSPDQFRPATPPALGSAEYAAAFNEVKAKGRATGSTRTADETQSALFWADGLGTVTPPGHWNQIAMQLAAAQGYGLSANARLFAMLNVALADAAIASWDAKYTYGLWRPVTAIVGADGDGNAATSPDGAWTPLLVTPNFPSYTSGHSTFSGAAQVVLESFFGTATGFTTGTEAPGVGPRTFASFQQAAEEAGRSRILGGIHYSFDNQAGLAAGRSVANYVLQAFSVAADTRAPTVSATLPVANGVASANVLVRGTVLDNLSGVTSLEVQTDGGAFVPLAFDAGGNFAFPTAFAVDGSGDGAHTFVFRATDFAGNASLSAAFSFTLDTLAPTIDLASPTAASALAASSRLTGVVSGTGSAVTSLKYTLGGGPLSSVVFDPATGAFDEALDLSLLSPGSHELTLMTRDAAGIITTTTIEVSLAAAIPLTVSEYTPAAGATEVGSTQRPKVTFSRPVMKSTLTGDTFFATDTTGAKLPASVVVTDDGTAAWLFFTGPMPGASTITVTVDGAGIRSADGSYLDGAGTGTPGSKLTFSFTTVNLASLPGTSITGVLADPGPDLRPNTIDDVRRGPDGVLMTADDVYLNPIAGARVYILGQEAQAVFTDAQGRFTLPTVPSGNVKFVLDGMTATNAPAGCYFPEMVMDLTIEPGKANTLMGSMGTRDQMAASEEIRGVYLPRLKSAILQDVSDAEPTMITVPADAAPDLTPEQRELLTAEVQPGTAVGADGQVMTNVQVGISTVPTELIREMLPPGVSEPPFTITVQAPGVVNFTTPVQVSYPNVDNLAPGTKTLFISFDHATGRLVIDGTATVSADGKSIVTDPDGGISHPGWHFVIQGSPSLFQVGTLKPVPDPIGSGADFRQSDQLFPLIDAAFNELFTGAINDLVSYIPFLDPFTDPIEVSPLKNTLHNLIRACYLAGDLAKGADLSIVSRYYEKFLSGVGGRTLGEPDVTELVRQEPLVQKNLADYKNLLEPLITQTIEKNIDAVNGVLDLNDVRDDLVSALSGLVLTPPVVASNGTLFLCVDNTAGATLEIDLLRADGTITDPSVGGTGTWTARMVYTVSDDFGFDPKDVERTLKFAIEDAIAAGVAIAGAKASVDQALDDVANLRLGDALTHAQEAYAKARTALNKSKSFAVNLGGAACVELFRLEQAHGYAAPYTTDYRIDHPADTSLSGTFKIPPGFGDVVVRSSATKAKASAVKQAATAPPTGIPVSTAVGFGQSGQVYYRLEVASGLTITGVLKRGQFINDLILPPNQTFIATFYAPQTNASLQLSGRASTSGVPTFIAKEALDDKSPLGVLELNTVGGVDSDSDGIPDVGEYAIGTNPNGTDSDNDGISDASELEQGLDPLDGRAFPTGVIANLTLQGNPEGVTVEGDRIYAATGDFGLAVIDGTRFDNPILLGQLDLPGYASDVAVDAGLQIAAVASGTGGGGGGGEDTIYLVDVSNPRAPRLLQAVNVDATLIEVADGVAYATAGTTLYAVDLVTGTVLQALPLPGFGEVTGLAREGAMLYAYLSGSDTFLVIDIANEGAAVVRGRLDVDVASSDVGLFVGNGVAWLAGSGLRTIDVSDPDNPQVIQTPTGSQFFNARRMPLNGSGLGLLLPDGGNFLQVYDTSDPTNVADLLLQLNLSGNARDVVVSRGVAYIATSSGLEVVNYLPFDNQGVAPTISISTSAVDVDLINDGLQVFEGSSLPVRVNVSDDVQVRNVELLVNGQVVRNDVSFPFDFFAVAPQVAPGVTSFTLQVRANDTGGNVALSDVLTIGLVNDTSPPTITSFVPPTNSSQLEPIQTVQVRFSKAMSAASVTSATVRVRDGAGNFLTPTSFQLRDDDRLAQLTFDPLLVGTYQIVVSAGVTDRAGNLLSATDVVSPFTLTPRATLATTATDADPGTPGLQVFEGATLSLTVTVAAGVSVQMVELLVNGQVVATDTEGPFEFSFVAPNIAPGASGFSLLAKVTDTAGLATFTTPPLDVGLLEDVTPPTIAAVSPAPDDPAFEGLTQVTVTFSEPLAAASVSAANFTLFMAGDGGVFDGTETEVPISGIQLLNDDTQVQVNTPALAKGVYQLRLSKDGLTDRALNPLGTGVFTSDFTLQEQILLNGSFETGDFTSWTITPTPFGSAQIVTSWSAVPFTGLVFQPIQGARFALLESGQQNVFEQASQQFTAQPGDVITGWAFFDTSDYLPYSDSGYVRIYNSSNAVVATPFFANISTVGSYGQTPWTQWQYTFTTSGTFRIEAGVANGGDSGVNSYLGLDAVQLVRGQPQLFAGAAKAAGEATPLAARELQPAIDQAVADLEAAGFDVTGLSQVQFHLVDLPGSLLGWAVQNTIWIDHNAAGHGWFTDASPGSSAAFTLVNGANELTTSPASPAFGRVDLLTVVTHELGHVLGFPSIDPAVLDHDWMTATLGTGVRRLPHMLPGHEAPPFDLSAPGAADFPAAPTGSVTKPAAAGKTLPVTHPLPGRSSPLARLVEADQPAASVGLDANAAAVFSGLVAARFPNGVLVTALVERKPDLLVSDDSPHATWPSLERQPVPLPNLPARKPLDLAWPEEGPGDRPAPAHRPIDTEWLDAAFASTDWLEQAK